MHVCVLRPKTTSGPTIRSKLNSRQTQRPQTVGLSEDRLSGGVMSQVQPISIDVENTVQKLEKALVDNSGEGEVANQSYHGDDILPEAAQDMGSGIM